MTKDPMSDRAAILLALMDERSRPDASETVIFACETALQKMPDLKERVKLHIEMTCRSD